MSRIIRIGDRAVGEGQPTLVIGELSGNHNGDLGRALDTIRAIAGTGCEAVKFQTYTADTLTLDCDRPDFIVPGDGPWGGRTLHDLYREAHTPWEWHEELFRVAREEGLIPISTPFDGAAVDLLVGLDCPALKVASFELVDDGLLAQVARAGRPVILSTGMATMEEVDHALAVLRTGGARDIVILRCTSAYPAPDQAMNLRSIPELRAATGALVGLSDHSQGLAAPLAAVALGACIIEKHVTLSRADGGVDSHFSLEPRELTELVDAVRRVDAMMGDPVFGAGEDEKGSLVFRRSLYFVRDLEAGATVGPEDVRSIRPGYGLAPRFLPQVLGRTLTQDVVRGARVEWDVLEGEPQGRDEG